MALTNTKINPEFMLHAMSGDVNLTDVGSKIYCKLVTTSSTVDAADPEFMSDLSTELQECSTSGYAQQELSSVTVAIDESNRRVELDADDITFSSVGSGATINGFVLVYDPDGTDTDSQNILISTHKFASNFATDGDDIVIAVNAEGLVHFSAAVSSDSAFNLEFLKAALAGGDYTTGGSETWYCKLIMTNNTSEDQNPSPEFEDDITTLDEMDGSGYVTKTVTVTPTLSGQVVKLDFADQTWTSLGAGTRSVAGFALFYNSGGSDDSASNRLVMTNRATNARAATGADFDLKLNASGAGDGEAIAS